MSFNKKILLFSFFLVIVGGFYSYKIYKNSRPKPKSIPPREELVVTIIPGWNLRQVADYLVKSGFASSSEDVYKFTGRPATDYRRAAFVLPKIEELKILADKPAHVSYEGYLAPETYRVFKDASLVEVLNKIIRQRNKEIGEDIWLAVEKSGRSFFEILTMASILEKEVKFDSDKAKVADLLWRRYDKKWALQVDSSVHYAVNKIGTVFTTEKDRAADSLWNTYKYRGLPLGPISNPGLDSIKAALYPEKNNYWYFLTGKDGRVYYAKTLEEHNFNRARYLSF